jgi:hypothetical protein
MRKAAGGSGLPERTKKQTQRVYRSYEAAPNESGRHAPLGGRVEVAVKLEELTEVTAAAAG